MASSGRDHGYDEKRGSSIPPHMMDETPIARGVRTNSSSDEEHAVRRGSRKLSVVASLKANYGLAEAPAYAESVKVGYDSTHRKLKPRHIQLIGIGGTIGTALYVQIGRGLLNGGPGSLFLAFTIW
jgi:amino acid permease